MSGLYKHNYKTFHFYLKNFIPSPGLVPHKSPTWRTPSSHRSYLSFICHLACGTYTVVLPPVWQTVKAYGLLLTGSVGDQGS